MNYELSNNWTAVLFILAIWDIVWRGMALWRSGRNNQQGWFVALLLINSAGILPIIYLLTNKKVEK